MQKYAKSIVAVIGATLIAVATQFPELVWLPIVVAFVTAFGVYIVPNLPSE